MPLSPEIAALANSDTAMVTLINLLTMFLDLKGIISRVELMTFLQEAIAAFEKTKPNDPQMLQLLKGIVETLSREPPALN